MDELERRLAEDDQIAVLKQRIHEESIRCLNMQADLECLRDLGDNQSQLIAHLNRKLATYREVLTAYAYPDKFKYDKGLLALSTLNSTELIGMEYMRRSTRPK